MAAVADLTEEERYFFAILQDQSGIDQAEFSWTDETSTDFVFRCWDFQYCLSGDTVLYTREGRRRLRDVVGRVTLVTEDEGDRGRWVDAEVKSFGIQELLSVTLERRGVTKVIHATAEHRWFAGVGRADRRVYREVTTESLNPGDYLRPMASPREPFSLDRTWVQAGIVFGDGTRYGGRSRVYLWGDKTSLESWFDAVGTDVKRDDVSVPGRYVGSLPGWYKDALPALDASAAERWGWLAGYFATDGSIAADGTCVITSRDLDAVEWVREVATSLGVVCGQPRSQDAETGFGSGVQHIVTLRPSDLPPQFFLRPAHQARRVVKSYRSVDSWKVVAVTRTGRTEEVFCAVVPGTHSFVLDGDILTGNCWYRKKAKFQIDQCARAVGKSVGIQMRAWAFCFTNPGEDMLITAPEMIHLDPVTKNIEDRILSARMSREFLKKTGQSIGIKHRPFEVTFRNGAKILGRIPQKDGRGVKGSVAAGALVTTPVGHLPIEKINEGDLVLTHFGRFMPVLKVHAYEAETVLVAGAGHRGIRVSQNHRFFTRRNSNPQRTRNLGYPSWAVVDDEELTERHYWATPTSVPDTIRPDLPLNVDERLFFWLVGRYVADGSLSGTNNKGERTQISYTAHVDRLPEIESVAALAGIKTARRAHQNAGCVTINSTALAFWLAMEFGQHSSGKRIPLWMHTAPGYLQESFLEGYLTGDGHYDAGRDRWEMGTASKELAIGLRLMGQMLGKTTSLSWVDPKPNRMCAAPLRSWRVQMSARGNGIFEHQHLWQRIRKVEPAGTSMVYDLVVAEDFSYVADGLVHKGSSELEGW